MRLNLVSESSVEAFFVLAGGSASDADEWRRQRAAPEVLCIAICSSDVGDGLGSLSSACHPARFSAGSNESPSASSPPAFFLPPFFNLFLFFHFACSADGNTVGKAGSEEAGEGG